MAWVGTNPDLPAFWNYRRAGLYSISRRVGWSTSVGVLRVGLWRADCPPGRLFLRAGGRVGERTGMRVDEPIGERVEGQAG